MIKKIFPKNFRIAFIVCLLGAPGAFGATVLHVPADQPSLQVALDTVPDGGIVELAAGTYSAPSGGFTIYPDLDGATRSFTVRAATGATVQAVLDDLGRQFPGVADRLFEKPGQLRRFVNVYLNDEDIRYLDSLTTAVKDGDELSIIPAVAGG